MSVKGVSAGAVWKDESIGDIGRDAGSRSCSVNAGINRGGGDEVWRSASSCTTSSLRELMSGLFVSRRCERRLYLWVELDAMLT